MTGRLGNIISTYVNFIAIQYKLGYKYHLPLYMDSDYVKLTKPYLNSIFKNVSFPIAHWTNFGKHGSYDAESMDELLFYNKRTGGRFASCTMNFVKAENIKPLFTILDLCAQEYGCNKGDNCINCPTKCECSDIWITKSSGQVYLKFLCICN